MIKRRLKILEYTLLFVLGLCVVGVSRANYQKMEAEKLFKPTFVVSYGSNSMAAFKIEQSSIVSDSSNILYRFKDRNEMIQIQSFTKKEFEILKAVFVKMDADSIGRLMQDCGDKEKFMALAEQTLQVRVASSSGVGR